MNREQIYFAIIGVGVVATSWFVYSNFIKSDDKARKLEPAQLVDQMNNAATPELRQQAAEQLASAGETALVPLRATVTATDQAPEVRAVAAESLGAAKDWQGVPALLKAMEDPSPVVRGRAAVAVQKILGTFNPDWNAMAAPEQRAVWIKQFAAIYRGVNAAGQQPKFTPAEAKP